MKMRTSCIPSISNFSDQLPLSYFISYLHQNFTQMHIIWINKTASNLMLDCDNISPFTLSMSLNYFTSSHWINWSSYSRYNIHSFMRSLPHISTSDIRCTSQNRIHRTMQRIFYKRKIVRTFDFRQLNLAQLLSTTEFPLHFWNWILPSSSISSRDSCSQKNRKNQILYPLFHTFFKNYILKSENQYTPLLKKNKESFLSLW